MVIITFTGNDDHYDGNGSQQPWTAAHQDLSVTWDLVVDSERCECNKPDTIAIPLLSSRGPLQIHSSTAENLGPNITENSQECDSFDQFYDLESKYEISDMVRNFRYIYKIADTIVCYLMMLRLGVI